MTANTPATAGVAPCLTPTGRLGQGELRRQVAAYLAATPGPHSATEVARDLCRSSGAVANALAKLADHGQADRLPSTPVTYRANAATVAAANGMSPAPTGTTMPNTRTPKPPAAAPASGTATTSPPPPATTGPVTRPGGQAYRPRVLADIPDVDALRKLRTAGVPALLYGPPGTGKTSLIEAAFPDLITVAGDGDTTTADFVGEYTQNPDGTFAWVNGPLVTAMTQGRVLFIDDATLISPAVLAVVYPAMDGRREITVKARNGETVKAADGFYVAGGHNPGAHGAVLTEALSSRFALQVKVSTDYDLARALKIEPRAIRAAQNLAARQASGEIGWAPQLRELIAFQRIAGVLGDDAAIANLIGIAPEEDRDVVAQVTTAVFGKHTAPLALGRQI
jgi:nitric oxide reductase NorQ protein